MIKPLILANKSFSSNLIQGPLAGVSCAPFRRLIWQFSQPAFTCTEMISCKTLIHQSKQSHRRFIFKDKSEGPLSFQLAGNDAIEVAEATKRVTDYGADIIDLNCGCPVNKIRSKGSGSSLLTQPSKLYQLIKSMKQNTHLPVSIKIRVEGIGNEKFNAEIVKVVKDAGIDFLVVHGRHWTEHYETPCRYDQIQFFVEELTTPVIGNGDISDLISLKRMYATGCAGVMIGRAGVGQPWLIAKLMAEMQGESYSLPETKIIGSAFLQHVNDLIDLLQNEKFAILQARTFAKYYARYLPTKKEFVAEINSCDNLPNLIQICSVYFTQPDPHPSLTTMPIEN